MPRKKTDGPKGGAPAGNQNGIILKDKEVRQDAYMDYCKHLSTGQGKKGWFYEKNGFRCSWQTMEEYIKDSVEFDPIHKLEAESKGYKRFENVVIDSATGSNKDANTASLQMLMRNKYGWDRPDQNSERNDSRAIAAVDAVCAQLTLFQSSRRIENNSNIND